MPYYQNVATNGIANFQSSRFLEEEFLYLPACPTSLESLGKQLLDLVATPYARRIANLRRTRDLLLPKLISGELDVEHLDIDTGDPLMEATT